MGDSSAPTIRLLSVPERTAALAEFTGRGVVMAFIDSGFYPHPDLGQRVRAHIDATEPRIVTGGRFYARPEWYAWHGQMTSVIAAGDGRTSSGLYRGCAPEAELVLIKVSNPRRQIKEADILRGMNWLIENAPDHGVRVVNISVGGDFPSDEPQHPLHVAVERLHALGMVVVIAAGNSGTAMLLPPASAPQAIIVGGYDDHNSPNIDDWKPYPSNYGRAYDGSLKPDLLAPARWLPSPILPGSGVEREARWLVPLLDMGEGDERRWRALLQPGFRDLGVTRQLAQGDFSDLAEFVRGRILEHKLVDFRHQYVDGTSVSSAIVASVIAQMLQANPALVPDEAGAILRETALFAPNLERAQQGGGVLNAPGAVQAAHALFLTQNSRDPSLPTPDRQTPS